MYNVENVLQTFQNYNGFTIILPLFLVAAILVLQRGVELQKKRITLLVLLAVLLIFNDISRKIIGKLAGTSTYYRFIWILPILVVIAYIMVEVWFGVEQKKYRAVMIALALSILIIEDISYISRDSLRLPESADKIDHTVQEVCEMIDEYKETEQPRVAFDVYLYQRVRSYDASILLGISRPAYLYILGIGYGKDTGKHETAELIIQAVESGEQADAKKLDEALLKDKIDYLVIRTDYGMDEYLAAVDWVVKDLRGGYTLYGKET